MNVNMNVTIRRLMSTFILLFLLISGIAAYVQIGNQAFYAGPTLAHSAQFDQNIERNCPPYDAPVRGNVYDRTGVKLAWSVPDATDKCVYHRMYDPRVATAGLAPLLGYYSARYGAAGLESTYNDQLAGVNTGTTPQDVANQLLHKPRYGQDIYLTIDINLQVAASQNYNSAYLSGGVCQNGANPPGSVIVENPNTGEILALVSRPSFDPNKIDDNGYFQQLQGDPQAPLLNHGTQGLYDPGSAFKTLTLLAALDSGVPLDKQFSKDEATHFTANGESAPFEWIDYTQLGEWQNLQFPITLEQAYAYSDNTIFAREAVDLGADTWLSYIRKFGIATPGTSVPAVQFDGSFNQSSAYNKTTNGKPTDFSVNLLAESGFGQGQLLITPLTMTEVASTIAANGSLYEPFAVAKSVAHDGTVTSHQPTLYTGAPVLRPETTTAVRKAMWSVSSFGTGATVANPNQGAPNPTLANSPVKEGGKTGTAQGPSASPQTWWISLAPDDAAPGGGPAKLAIVLTKEHSGEGACQVFVADNTYLYAMNNHIGPYGS